MSTYVADYSKIFNRANEAVTAALGPIPDGVEPARPATSETLAGRIDHTLLKADATLSAIETLCQEAVDHRFASVCVTRWFTAAERLAGTGVMVCTVVGFPLGAMTRLAKAEEARITVAGGADGSTWSSTSAGFAPVIWRRSMTTFSAWWPLPGRRR